MKLDIRRLLARRIDVDVAIVAFSVAIVLLVWTVFISESRSERDEAVADLVHGRLDDPGAVKPLPVNLRWVRAYDVRNHEPDTTKMLSSERKKILVSIYRRG